MDRSTFLDILNKVEVSLNDNQCDQFDEYYKILVEWNEFMNLTGITEYDEVLLKHFVDSLAIKKAIVDISNENISKCGKDEIGEVLNLDKGISIIDVGTGAGFPGLPLKIAFKNSRVYLLDSLNKRIKFLNEVIDKLSLENIEAVHGRAEEAARKEGVRESFTLGVSRAVANLSTLCEYVLPFVEVGGYFVAYKSGEIEEEAKEAANAIGILGGEVKHIYKFELPGTDNKRSFVFIKKIKKTAKKYPRKAGLPSKEPLK